MGVKTWSVIYAVDRWYGTWCLKAMELYLCWFFIFKDGHLTSV